jgi:hypothetical protein
MRLHFGSRQAKLLRPAHLWVLIVACGVIGLTSMASFATPFPISEWLQSEAQLFAIASSVSEQVPAVNSFEEIWKKSQSLRPEPSTDTTPVAVKIGEVSYSIPRNYILNLHLGFPVLKVTYPGFNPLTEETSGCFDRKLQAKLGCTALELRLAQGKSLPNETQFENLLKLVPSNQKLSPRRSADGYLVYDLGPENARTEIYRSESEDIFFTCIIFDNNGVRDAVCDDAVSVADGNTVKFFFSLNQIGHLRDFEAGIRQLMSHFQTGDSQ